jgi:hypothetical protein
MNSMTTPQWSSLVERGLAAALGRYVTGYEQVMLTTENISPCRHILDLKLLEFRLNLLLENNSGIFKPFKTQFLTLNFQKCSLNF